MGLDYVMVNFLAHTALGAASVLLIIVIAGIGIRRSSTALRRTHR